ncbi:MAG: hypothetical protein IIA44_10150 [Acidobacteria bacterium]|nr:hypothetical protein [Acidobacteriota bacterium]
MAWPVDVGGGATYAWTVTGGTIASLPPFSFLIAYTAGAGPSVVIDLTVTEASGCVSTCQKIVTVNPNPDATISTAAAVCDGTTGNEASVTDPGVGSTFAWTVTGGTIEGLPPFGNLITYTAGAGPNVTIDVTVTDPNGCVSSSQTVVTVNPNPDATIATASAVCEGTTGNAASVPNAGIGATYAWTVSGGTIENLPPFTFSITYTAGVGPNVTIDVTVTDGNGCVSSSQTVVTVNPNPACIISAEAAVCADTSGHNATVSDAGGGASYAWTVTGGTLDSGDGTTQISYTAGSGANVTLDVTVTDANGCVSSCQFVVTVNANPDCTISANDLVCAGFSGNLASVPDAGGVFPTYNWTITGGTLNTGQGSTSISYTAGTGTSLTLEVTVTNDNGCVSTCQKVVEVNAPDCTILGADDVCFQSTNNFASVTNAGPNSGYDWTVTGGTLTSGQGSLSITYTAGAGLTVTLNVTVTNINGCVSSCQKIVNIIQPSIDVTLELEAMAATVTRDVTFVITDCGGSVDTRVLPVTVDTPGTAGRLRTVTISSTSPNANWISVQEGHTLSRLESVTYGTCSVATVVLTLSGSGKPLLAGDFHTGIVLQDNLCDIVDFSILASQWNELIDLNESSGADVTGDGVQEINDFIAIQVNFFNVGEAADACALGVSVDPSVLQVSRAGLDPVVSTLPLVRSSVPVDSLAFPNARNADLDGDGDVDVADIRAFARLHRITLLPEFSDRLEKLEARKGRYDRSRE